MARKITTDVEIDNFILKVIKEAHHHAGGVERIIKPLSDAVRNRMNLKVDTIEVYERNGQLARTCWIVLNGNRYVFSYNYGSKVIDLRERTLRGHTLFKFNNSTSHSDTLSAISSL